MITRSPRSALAISYQIVLYSDLQLFSCGQRHHIGEGQSGRERGIQGLKCRGSSILAVVIAGVMNFGELSDDFTGLDGAISGGK